MDEPGIPGAVESLSGILGVDVTASNREALHAWLTAEVVRLLLYDMERLLSILYRVDVRESKVKEAFVEGKPEQIAFRIAELMIERELQKVESRRKYR
jgi:hypothetical protein